VAQKNVRTIFLMNSALPLVFSAMKQFREAIVRLFNDGMPKRKISRLLRVPESTVRKVIDRFQETGTNADRHGRGRKRTARTSANAQKIKSRLQRNPRLSTRKLAASTGISRRTVQRIVSQDLKLKPFKLQEAHSLTDSMKATRLQRSRALKRRFAARRHRLILFSDEKFFTIEQAHNRQNDRIWAPEPPSPQMRIVGRSQKPKSVMVWAGITYDGKTPLFFIEDGLKIDKMVYQAMLREKVLPWARVHFGDRQWIFQQDSAPSHRAKSTQDWIRANFPNFIDSQQWPPYSPDLNPLDFSIWSILEAKACAKPHASVASLKRALKKAWNEISLETIAKTVDNFPKRLQTCITSGGGHFEQK
jgi:transposase